MIYLIIDLLIYNYTNYKSFFFLLNISKASLFTNLVIAFIIDNFILHTYLLNMVYVLIFYLLNKYFFKLKNAHFLKYTFVNLIYLIIYYSLNVFLFKYFSFINLTKIIIFNLIIIMISYINHDKSIDLL